MKLFGVALLESLKFCELKWHGFMVGQLLYSESPLGKVNMLDTLQGCFLAHGAWDRQDTMVDK